jgi:hypothetical protein
MSAFRVTFTLGDRTSTALVFGPAALAKYVTEESPNWPDDRELRITSVLAVVPGVRE